jgi:hypothetical protein
MRYILLLIVAAFIVFVVRDGFVRRSARVTATKSGAAAAPEVPAEYQSSHLRILMFYSADPTPRMGQPATVCYGVLNAVSLRMDPPLADVGPSPNRCVSVTVDRPQLLTLTAEGKDGERAVASFTLGSAVPRAAFTFLQLSTFSPKRGERVTMCYGTNSADRVRLLPNGPPLEPGGRVCTEFAAVEPSYRLIAESKGGRDEIPLPIKYAE